MINKLESVTNNALSLYLTLSEQLIFFNYFQTVTVYSKLKHGERKKQALVMVIVKRPHTEQYTADLRQKPGRTIF